MSLLSGVAGQAPTAPTNFHNHQQMGPQTQNNPNGHYHPPTMVTALDQKGRPLGQIWMQIPSNASFDPQNPPTLAIPQHALPAGTAYAQIPSLHPSAPPQIVSIAPETRTRLTREQHQELEEHFKIEPKPSTNDKKVISSRFNVPLEKINNWFQNRRAKVRQDYRKQLMVNALAKAGLDAETVQGVKGKITLPSWRRKSKSDSRPSSPASSPKASRCGSTSSEKASQPTANSSPDATFSPKSTGVANNTIHPVLTPKPPNVPHMSQNAVTSQDEALSSAHLKASGGLQLHSSVSTPNFRSAISQQNRPAQAGIDPRLLSMAENIGGVSVQQIQESDYYSWPLMNQGGQGSVEALNIKKEWNSSSPTQPGDAGTNLHGQRQDTPDTYQPMDGSTANALAASMSRTSLRPNSSTGHQRSISGASASSGHLTIAQRRNTPNAPGPLRAVASMSVLSPHRSLGGLPEEPDMEVDSIPSILPGASESSYGAIPTPRKGPGERTIRKVRSGIQKQTSTVGLSAVAKSQSSAPSSGNAHSRSISIGANATISPRKRDRKLLATRPSMPNLNSGRGPLFDVPSMPPFPSFATHGTKENVPPSAVDLEQSGFFSPPEEKLEMNGMAQTIAAPSVSNGMTINSGLLPRGMIPDGVPVSSLSGSLCGLAGMPPTYSPPTTPLHLSTLQQLFQAPGGEAAVPTDPNVGSAQQLASSTYDLGMYTSMPLFDQSMGGPILGAPNEFAFDSFSGLSDLVAFTSFDPMTSNGHATTMSQMESNLMSMSSMPSSAVSAIGTTGFNSFNLMPTSGVTFEGTPPMFEDPFISPDLNTST